MAASDEQRASALAARLAPALSVVRRIPPVWQRLILLIAGRLLAFALIAAILSLVLAAPAPPETGAQVAERLAVTMPLFLLAAILALVIGLPLGFLAALGGWFGRMFQPVAAVGMLVPAFWLGMLLVLLFSGVLQWFPAGGFVPWGEDFAGALLSLLLPATALALPASLGIALAAATALRTDPAASAAEFARRLGQVNRRALLRPGVAAALPALLPRLGTLLTVLLGGSLIVENVFYLPGLGRQLFTAALVNDVALVRSGLLVLVAICLVIQLLAEIAECSLGDAKQPAAATPIPARRSLLLRLSLIATLFLLLAAFASLIWTPHPLDRAAMGQQLAYPSFTHWLGTDAQGLDLLSLLMKGLLTSFVVSGVGTAVGLIIGGATGLAASIWGRSLPTAVSAVSAVLIGIPAVALAIAVTVLSSAGAINAMVAIGFTSAPVFAVVTMRSAQQLWQRGFVSAALQAGSTPTDAWFRHVLPALTQVLAGVMLLQMAAGVVAEAALSYAGVGAHAATFSLGLMLRDAQSYLLFEPLLAVAPGVAVVLLATALGLAGWALRGGVDGAH